MNRLLSAMRCGPYGKSEPHHHPVWELGWYTAGRGQAWIGQEQIEVGTGTLVCYPPRIPHHELAVEPFCGVFVLVDEISGRATYQVINDEAGRTGGRIIELIREQFAADGALAGGVAQQLLDALVVFLRTQQGRRRLHPQVERLQSQLQERVGDPTLRIASLMAALPISRDHLRRLFTEEVGRTPVAFLRELRIHRAQNLLGMGRSIKEAGSESGFDDPYYFSRVFREVTGIAPSAWRAGGENPQRAAEDR